jgi:hypothetical protein
MCLARQWRPQVAAQVHGAQQSELLPTVSEQFWTAAGTTVPLLGPAVNKCRPEQAARCSWYTRGLLAVYNTLHNNTEATETSKQKTVTAVGGYADAIFL